MLARIRTHLREYLRGTPAPGSGPDLASLHVLPVDHDQLLAAMSEARAGGSTAVYRLSTLLMRVDRNENSDVAAHMTPLLAGADPELWKNLDLVTRQTWWGVPDWAERARERIIQGNPSPLALVMASFHPVGYVREAAVAALAEIDDEVALPALALRTGDWVPQVRDRARTAVGKRLSTSSRSLLGVGPLAVLLADRVHGSWLFDQLGESITSLNNNELRQLLDAPDRRLRRVGYSIALRDDRLTQPDLLDAARHDGDLVIRVECADSAIRAAVAAGTIDDVRPLTTSGTAAVRAAAVTALARAGETNVAGAALTDRNPMVREVAQAAIRRVGADPAERYRTLVLASTPADPAAVAGLGETGTTADIALVQPSLTDARPRGRVEAVRAMRRLGSIDVATLAQMLEDPSAAVTRQVATTLTPRAGDIAANHLDDLLDPRRSPHVRTAAYRLLRAQDVWTRLITDLKLYDDDHDNLRLRAQGDLSGWLERDAATTYAPPNGANAERLDLLLRQTARSLGPNRERLLRFHLGLTNVQDSRQMPQT